MSLKPTAASIYYIEDYLVLGTILIYNYLKMDVCMCECTCVRLQMHKTLQTCTSSAEIKGDKQIFMFFDEQTTSVILHMKNSR